MNIEIIGGLAAFALVSSITPGPNNLMLMASGANYGFRRTAPHMLGVSIGFVVMVILVGVGLVQLFDAYPLTYSVLKVLSVGYLLYLAGRIATAAAPEIASPDDAGSGSGKPFTFLQAAAFQWVNPKAWTMALTSLAVYAPSQSLEAVVLVAVVFGAVNLPSVSCWTALGQQLRKVLNQPARLRAFNWLMASLLVASLYPIVLTS